MKQPYRWLLGMAILLVILAATYYLSIYVHEFFTIGIVIAVIVFSLMANDFHMFD